MENLGVWIVIDEGPDAPQPVLAVLETQDEASGFMEAHVPGQFAELAYAHYDVGWTFDGTRYSR